MAPVVTIDEAWLLQVAQTYIPGDPDVTDYGSMAAAVARHRHMVMGTLVYPEPHHRAGALLHTLACIPALEHSNELFATMIAVAYLQASGEHVKVTTGDAVHLVAAVVSDRLSIRDTSTAVKSWIS